MRKLHFVLFLALLAPAFVSAQSAPATGQPFVIEYYYKAKWSNAE